MGVKMKKELDGQKYRTFFARLMIVVVLALFFLPFFGLFAGRAEASDSGACYNIADSDRRTFCLAKAHKDRSYCNSIKAAEIRAQCLAEVVRK